jgi:hypothetical protein
MSFIICPICSSQCLLKTNGRHLWSSKVKKYLYIDWYNYECVSCMESFTTTELDTKSYNNIESVEKREIRKIKISKINERTL